MITKYLFAIAYALSISNGCTNSMFATIDPDRGKDEYDYWKIKRMDPNCSCLKLWHRLDYCEKWTFCGQFDLVSQTYHAPSEFESEAEWL